MVLSQLLSECPLASVQQAREIVYTLPLGQDFCGFQSCEDFGAAALNVLK